MCNFGHKYFALWQNRFDIKEKEGLSPLIDADGKPIITKDGYQK